MKRLMTFVAGVAALAIAAPALAADPPLPYGQTAPGPTNPFPAGPSKDKKSGHRVAFSVETVTASPKESVWGKWAKTSCTQTNFFPRGERIVFHISAINALKGTIVEGEDVKYAYLKVPGLPNIKLKYGPHGKDPATAPWDWYIGWDVPPDYPLGLVAFQVVIKLKDMKAGEVATYTQMPLAPEQLQIVEQRPAV